MQKMFDLNSYPVKECLEKLLDDKTTGKNIIFATDDYLQYDKNAGKEDEITVEFLNKYGDEAIRPRFCKSSQHQSDRTKENAEVFTPSWICNKMIDYCDEEIQGDWKQYVCTTFLEITCGEAPFLCSRYDSSTGESIAVEKRRGIIDRKLKAVYENSNNADEWTDNAFDAYKTTYGYEWQGDSLLIARINLLLTFVEHYYSRFDKEPALEQLFELIDVICWNVIQMDGLKMTIPYKEPKLEQEQMSLFDIDTDTDDSADNATTYDWKNNKQIEFCKIEKGKAMKFDFCIGNPPYQEEAAGDSSSDKPVYHLFMEEAYKISDKVELITPARFLFNAGATPSKWNDKMINDSHLNVLHFEQLSSSIFPNTDIKGGVAITFRDKNKSYEKIGVFTSHKQLNTILSKVSSHSEFVSLADNVITRTAYRLTDKLHEDFPNAINQLSKGHKYDMSTNIFDRLPEIFTNDKPQDDKEYIQIFGRQNNERVYKYVRRDYVNFVTNLNKYKIILPKSNGSGAIGEVLSTPLIGTPLIGNTESFISIGSFDNKSDAENALKYIKSKFARTMLGVLKITQDNPPEKWKYVPLQDFTENSDIDWSKSISEIDQQLYKKYNLSKDEIDFIESHVKEMK